MVNLLQWPTLPTLVMFPVLISMYVRLARREALAEFGEGYALATTARPDRQSNWRSLTV